jgi:hypothetical protein
LNEQLREYLVHTYSVNNNTCYPNSISDAVSLLSTFAKATVANNAAPSSIEKDGVDVIVQPDFIEHNEVDPVEYETTKDDREVTFSANVMATVIIEATTDADEDQFIGASFAQLQDVDDAYNDDEPDIVCYENVVDTSDVLDFDDGDEPGFVTEANTNAEEHNERIRERTVTISSHPHSDDIKDFELMIYHTAQRVLHRDSQNVGIYHYVPGRPDLITHTYDRNIPESIIDYSDALRFKFKCAGIHDTTFLMSILSKRTVIDVMAELKRKFNAVGMK